MDQRQNFIYEQKAQSKQLEIENIEVRGSQVEQSPQRVSTCETLLSCI